MFWHFGDSEGYFPFEGRNESHHYTKYIDIQVKNWKCDTIDCTEGVDIGYRACEKSDFNATEFTRSYFKSVWGPTFCFNKTKDIKLYNNWNYKEYQAIDLVVSECGTKPHCEKNITK